jgi:hypothetical protein
VRYEPAATLPREKGCQSGTIALGRAIKVVFPELLAMTAVYGCFNRRKARNAPSWSLHAEGRALDVGFQIGSRDLAWRLACHLVDSHVFYGVQRVIIDGHIWSIEQPRGWRALNTSSDQHHDHMHIEQYRASAAKPVTVQTDYVIALRHGRATA